VGIECYSRRKALQVNGVRLDPQEVAPGAAAMVPAGSVAMVEREVPG
jgi:hypothetical protein